MITITKHYHFYAAHRNELLNDKCSNIHGHTYMLDVEFNMNNETDESGVTMLFSEIDKHVEPFIRAMDHCFIIHSKDPLYYVLQGKTRLYVLEDPTSCENLAKHILNMLEDIEELPSVLSVTLAETTSSKITVYQEHYEVAKLDFLDE